MNFKTFFPFKQNSMESKLRVDKKVIMYYNTFILIYYSLKFEIIRTRCIEKF